MSTKTIALIKEILELTREQPSLIAGDEPADGLLENISRRQRLMDTLNALNEPLSGEAEALLREIETQDKINEALLKARMFELRDRLQKSKDGLTAVRGYERAGESDEALYFNKLK